MKLKLFQIDAFTNKVFHGNPAGVIILDNWIDEKTMQQIAMENNLSETAFIVKDDVKYNIRWFSPLSEIDFCGHATLASAYVLFEEYKIDSIHFWAKAVGDLYVSKEEDGFIKMVFPKCEPQIVKNIPKELLNGLSIKPKEVFVNQQTYFAVYENENENDIYNMEVNLEEIKKLAPLDVTITAPSQKYDFISRYFWPANGGAEDPVTGSMHTGAAPLWAKKLNKNKLFAYQASSRGGEILCEVEDNTVTLLGKAIKYMEGAIVV
jgi:PhzF family phenazine biosynthesis protein